MKLAAFLAITIAVTSSARADFSYTSTRKSSGGMAAAAGNATTKHYLKGQKMKVDMGDTASIMDFDAQTITSVNNKQKTYTVMKFSDLGAAMKDSNVEAKIDVKDTGQKKNINGFNASEMVMTMEVETPQTAQAGMKMQMEMDMWLSSDVPGAKELRAFYQKNAGSFPWAALAGGGGAQGMQKAMADMQKKMATSGGVPVLQIVKMKSAGAGAQAATAQSQNMDKARAQLEAMAKQGGPQGQAAQQALARMGGMAAAGGGGSLFEVTMESSDFSANSIPDSVFAIPAGYTKTDKPAIPGR